MRFNNINEFILRLKEKSHKKPMFDYQLGKLVLKCLFLVENRVLMISIKTLSFGHSIAFNENGYFNGSIPPEFYKSIVNEIKNKFRCNKITPMWEDLDNLLLTLDIDEISEGNENDVTDILKTLKTKHQMIILKKQQEISEFLSQIYVKLKILALGGNLHHKKTLLIFLI
jgi:hypothetical protein